MEKKEFKEELLTLLEEVGIVEKESYYWFIGDDGKVYRGYWKDVSKDKYYYGNYFETEKEAEFEAERLKVYRELRFFALDCLRLPDSVALGYDYFINDIIYLPMDDIYNVYGILFFESKECAIKAVESIGKDRVLKYYLEIEEQ